MAFMTVIRLLLILSFPVLICFTYSQTQLNFSIIYKLTKASSSTLSDIPGHVIGSTEGTGLGFFEDKSVAVMNGEFSYDYVNGSGSFIAHYTLSLEDGSGFSVKTVDAIADYNPKLEKTVFEGGIEFINGKGKFEGITGSGKITGKQMQDIEIGTAIYLDFVTSYEINK